ncbi:MAG TPA: hypothetical protein VEI97_21270, partial [bacterium]|nr:hypothetical protein [bacterium]
AELLQGYIPQLQLAAVKLQAVSTTGSPSMPTTHPPSSPAPEGTTGKAIYSQAESDTPPTEVP